MLHAATLALCLTLSIAATARSLGAQSLPSWLAFTPDVIGDATRVVRGGASVGNDALWNVDLQLRLVGPALGWRGGYVFLYVLGDGGTNPSRHVGDFQGVDNIGAPSTWKVFEAWVEQHFAHGHASALLGLYNLNSEFDVLGSAQLFLNSSFGIGADFSQSGVNGPSIFPTTSLALRVKAVPWRRWRVEAAAFDGVPGKPGDPYGTHVILRRSDGLLLAGEVAYFVPVGGRRANRAAEEARERPSHAGDIGRESQTVYDAKIALGAWGYTTRFPSVGPADASRKGHSYGAYLLGEARVVPQGEGERGVWTFGRVGFASARVNQVGAFVGGGVSWRGPWRSRPDDEVGIGVAAARNGAPYLAGQRAAGTPSDRWEVALEATYGLQARGWLTVQPDLQYVVHPGMKPARGNAVLLGLRLTVRP